MSRRCASAGERRYRCEVPAWVGPGLSRHSAPWRRRVCGTRPYGGPKGAVDEREAPSERLGRAVYRRRWSCAARPCPSSVEAPRRAQAPLGADDQASLGPRVTSGRRDLRDPSGRPCCPVTNATRLSFPDSRSTSLPLFGFRHAQTHPPGGGDVRTGRSPGRGCELSPTRGDQVAARP